MPETNDKLQAIFGLLAQQSLSSSSSQQGGGVGNSSVSDQLSNAGEAFQLNQVTESSSGFSFFNGGSGGVLSGLLGGLFGNESATPAASSTNAATTPSTSTAACQLDALTQDDLDKFTQNLVDDYRNGLNDIQTDATGTASERRDAVSTVWTWVRANLPGHRLMHSIAHSALSDADKATQLGWFAVQVLRVEFLLGWIQLGGLNQASIPTWERAAPDNLDEFYTSNDEMGGGDGDWCTRFAGYGRKRTGFTPGLITGLMFNSGFRMFEWSVNDRTHDHTAWPTRLGVTGATNEGVQVIQRADFRTLSTTLSSSTNLGRDIDNFFTTQGMTPQCGDILITGRSVNRWKNTSFNSHTRVVEEYSATDHVIYTIEGNADNRRCVGRKLELTNDTDYEKLLYLIRPGHQQHLGNSTPSCTLTQAQINSLRTGVANYVSELAAVAVNLNYLNSTDSDARVYTWYSGNAT